MKEKPTVEEVLELYDATRKVYDASGIYNQFEEDDRYYECDFKFDLKIPAEFAGEAVVLPTSRDMVDTCVDQTDITNITLSVPKQGDSPADVENAELMRKFGLGVLYRNNVEFSLSPIRASDKHYWMHGLTIIGTFYDADRYLDKPEQKEGESESDYAGRMDEWRAERNDSIPIVIQAKNPRTIMLDPYQNGGLFVFETRKELCYDVKNRFGLWTNPEEKKISDEVEHISFWNKDYRCELYDKEPVLKVKGGVGKHKYGFIPYTAIDSGLGNISFDNDLKKRYVGILRYIKDLLRSESRDYSLADILLGREVLTSGYLSGKGAQDVKIFSVKYGEVNRLPEGVTYTAYEPKLPPQALAQHMSLSADYIANHAAPRSVRGLGEQGVRAAADRQLLLAVASQRYSYSIQAYKHGLAKILTKCARIMKNVVPGDINVWAKTPHDEFDIEIKKDKMKEPFTFYVDFSPVSPEEDYRKHDDLLRMLQVGMITDEFAWSQMPNVDAKAMRKQKLKMILRNSPMYRQVIDQYIAGRLGERLAQIPVAEQVINQGAPPAPTGAPQEVMGRMTPTMQATPMPGSAEDLQNQLKNNRSPVPLRVGQGEGGGGNIR